MSNYILSMDEDYRVRLEQEWNTDVFPYIETIFSALRRHDVYCGFIIGWLMSRGVSLQDAKHISNREYGFKFSTE